MKIYYSAAVRSTSVIPRELVADQIRILKLFGEVLTDHLGLDPNGFDAGKSDQRIWEIDDALLQQSDIFVANVTAPSTGVGFMIARALASKKPCLCVYHSDAFPISAMISGCKEITKMPYTDAASFKSNVIKFVFSHLESLRMEINPKRILFVGAPGSGKSTAAALLASHLEVPHISSGQVLRDLISNHPTDPVGMVITEHMSAGNAVPADLMKQIVRSKLSEPECQILGYILDGYPPTFADLSNLIDPPNFVFVLQCSDNVAIDRQCQRNKRNTDNRELATHRVRMYHEQIPDYDVLNAQWYPHSVVIPINAELGPHVVIDTIKSNVESMTSVMPNKSFFYVQPTMVAKSDRFHFHIDTDCHLILMTILHTLHASNPKILGTVKVYPISKLVLGPQVNTCAAYQHMMNFHTIGNSNDSADRESFATGSMGDTMDYDAMRSVIGICQAFFCMAELEQYLGKWELKRNSIMTTEVEYDPLPVNMNELTVLKGHIPNPPLELHLAFNIRKDNIEAVFNLQTIKLSDLVARCEEAGLMNGGWFIFAHPTEDRYRSNEFYLWDNKASMDEMIPLAKARLFSQAKTLQTLVKKYFDHTIDVQLSLEVVHGIWQF
jgi:adenylate kinase